MVVCCYGWKFHLFSFFRHPLKIFSYVPVTDLNCCWNLLPSAIFWCFYHFFPKNISFSLATILIVKSYYILYSLYPYILLHTTLNHLSMFFHVSNYTVIINLYYLIQRKLFHNHRNGFILVTLCQNTDIGLYHLLFWVCLTQPKINWQYTLILDHN